VDTARIWQALARSSREHTDSAPPAMAMSHAPDRSSSRAVPIATVPEEHAVETLKLGPRAPRSMHTLLAALFTVVIGASFGETRRAPFSARTALCWS
jgi:hypothetical protein